MTSTSTITIHMASSLDGLIARPDGSVDWMETADRYEAGASMTPEYVEEVLGSIDCYVMGSRTYETALAFEALVRDVPLHLMEVQAFDTGMVELRYRLEAAGPAPTIRRIQNDPEPGLMQNLRKMEKP